MFFNLVRDSLVYLITVSISIPSASIAVTTDSSPIISPIENDAPRPSSLLGRPIHSALGGGKRMTLRIAALKVSRALCLRLLLKLKIQTLCTN
jgi:hypothetical protein